MVKSLYFKCGEEGVPFYDIQTSGSVYIGLTGYDFVGWFLPETYEDGDHKGEPIYTYIPEGSSEEVAVYPVYDENGEAVTDTSNRRPVFAREGVDEQILENKVTVKASDTQVTSDYMITRGADVIVCAKWVKSLQMQYILVYEEGKVLTDAEGKEYRNGDVIKEELFLGSAMSPGTGTPLELNGATFVRTYLDPECTEEPKLIERPDGYDPVKVYSKYIEGDWTIVSSDRTSVSNMFSGMYDEEKSFYILEDIDCSNMGRFNLNTAEERFSAKATIQGNGHIISNLSSRTNDISVFAVANAVSDKADIKGLVIENVTADLTVQGGSINNAPLVGGVLDTSNWLFGGMGSDEAFLAAYAENIKVLGENTLTIE